MLYTHCASGMLTSSSLRSAGLPLSKRSSPDLAAGVMAAAERELGDAVIGFELGNEPRW